MSGKKSDQIKKMQKALKNSLKHAAWDYVQYGIEDHFEPGNDARYGYPPLTAEYAKRKRIAVGQEPMLVYSGKLRDAIVGKGKIKVTADGVTIEFNKLPKYSDDVKETRDFVTPDQADIGQFYKAAQEYITAQAESDDVIEPLGDV